MFLILFRRELLANLMTLRFFVAVVTCLLLVFASTIVLLQDYKHRLDVYNTAVKTHREDVTDAKTYSQLRLYVDTPRIRSASLTKGLTNDLAIPSMFITNLCLLYWTLNNMVWITPSSISSPAWIWFLSSKLS